MTRFTTTLLACLFAPLLVVGCDAPDAADENAIDVIADEADEQTKLEPELLPGCFCPQVYMPVCGVDGHTYGNACMAGCAGVAIAYKGECEEGTCSSDADCPAKGQFCEQDGACGSAGTCEARPLGCSKIYAPVCGCDGKTYSNECFAHANGVSVASEGECSAGCTSNKECGKTQFCEQDGVCGGVGTCTARPDACLDVYDPVCGCDGNVWGNGCYAHSAGVSISSDDSCGIVTDK